MNRKILGIIIFAIILVAGLYYFTFGKEEKTPRETTPENNISEEINNEENEEDMVKDPVLDIAIGEEAPNFTLKNLNGDELSLIDYR